MGLPPYSQYTAGYHAGWKDARDWALTAFLAFAVTLASIICAWVLVF